MATGSTQLSGRLQIAQATCQPSSIVNTATVRQTAVASPAELEDILLMTVVTA